MDKDITLLTSEIEAIDLAEFVEHLVDVRVVPVDADGGVIEHGDEYDGIIRDGVDEVSQVLVPPHLVIVVFWAVWIETLQRVTEQST